MHDPSRDQSGGVSPALAVAVAVTTACGNIPAVSAAELVGDLDPMTVIAALGTAWSVTLRVALGDDGRDTALRAIGLAVAEESGERP